VLVCCFERVCCMQIAAIPITLLQRMPHPRPPSCHTTSRRIAKRPTHPQGISLLQLATGALDGLPTLLTRCRTAVANGQGHALLDAGAGAWDGFAGAQLLALALWCSSDAAEMRPMMSVVAAELAKLAAAVVAAGAGGCAACCASGRDGGGGGGGGGGAAGWTGGGAQQSPRSPVRQPGGGGAAGGGIGSLFGAGGGGGAGSSSTGAGGGFWRA